MRYHNYDIEKRIDILGKYNKRCAYCGCKLNIESLSIDHISPMDRGIKSDKYDLKKIENLNPCCQSCNSSKGNKSIEDWRLYIDELHYRLIDNNSQYRLLNRMNIVKEPKSFKFYFEKYNERSKK